MVAYRIALVLATAALAAPAQAQIDSYRGFELWGGYASWSDKDAAGLKPGVQGGLARCRHAHALHQCCATGRFSSGSGP